MFLGGGTPTFTSRRELARLLAALPSADEVTVEANPETITPELAPLLLDAGATRVSLGAQSFQPDLLAVLERRAGPDAVRRAFYHLRDAGFDNISLDLIYGIPGQSAADLASRPCGGDRARAGAPLLLRARGEARHPLHVSRTAVSSTRRRRRWRAYFELGRRRARRRRLPLVRDGELLPAAAGRPATTSATGTAATTSGSGSGRCRPSAGLRWRNRPSLGALPRRAGWGRAAATRRGAPRAGGAAAASGSCSGFASTSRFRSRASTGAVDQAALARMERLGPGRAAATEASCSRGAGASSVAVSRPS